MNRIETKRIVLMLVMLVAGIACTYASFPFTEDNNGHTVKNVLFIGDSQTGWMGERLTAYGVENGFEVATITWDGATPQKYANSGKLPSLIATGSHYGEVQESPRQYPFRMGRSALMARQTFRS